MVLTACAKSISLQQRECLKICQTKTPGPVWPETLLLTKNYLNNPKYNISFIPFDKNRQPSFSAPPRHYYYNVTQSPMPPIPSIPSTVLNRAQFKLLTQYQDH